MTDKDAPTNVVQLKAPAEPLRCPGSGRDADNDRALIFYFNRKPTDAELRYLHEVMQRAAVCSPVTP